MGFLGGSASSAQSLSNSISFNPIVNVGDGNDGSSSASMKSDTSATATAKDEFGLSAGVAVGDGASASGGPVGVGDTQPMGVNKSSGILGGSNTMLYVLLGVAGLGGGFYFLSKKKKK